MTDVCAHSSVVEDLEKLAERAVANKYTETDEYRDLRSVIDKANQCIKVVYLIYVVYCKCSVYFRRC